MTRTTGYTLFLKDFANKVIANGGKYSMTKASHAWKLADKDYWKEKAQIKTVKPQPQVTEPQLENKSLKKKRSYGKKRQLSGWNLFMIEYSNIMKASKQTTDMSQTAVAWKALKEEERTIWKNKAKALAPPKGKKRRPHAYNMFVKEQFAKSGKTNIATIGSLWRELNDQQKDIFKQKAAAVA